jgi:short-subunit dehydrogenase
MPRPELRTALVTGASAGIGRELTRQLARDRGFIVLATARRADRLAALAAEFPEGKVLPLAGDLSEPAFRDHLMDTADAMPGGGLDLLINNAAFGHYAPFAEQDQAIIARMIDVNVSVPFALARRALPGMLQRGRGQVGFISSTLGFVGLPYSAVYVATKHAVNGLVKSLAYELRGTPVRAWAACPNRTVSEFHQVALGNEAAEVPSGFAESTEKVARGILRALDRRAPLIYPTALAATVIRAAHWLPVPFDLVMKTWAARHFREELRREKSGQGTPSS